MFIHISVVSTKVLIPMLLTNVLFDICKDIKKVGDNERYFTYHG